MRVLFIGTLLGVLLGLCSFWLLDPIDWLNQPQRLVLSVVIGFAFAGLVWTFGIVRWLASRFDRRRRQPSPSDSVGVASVAEVELDVEMTSEVDLPLESDETWIQGDVPSTGPQFEEQRGPYTDYGPYEDDDDEGTTQLVSRAELKALAKALLEGKPPPDATAASLSAFEADELLARAETAAGQGQFDEALDLFTQVVDGSGDARAYLGRGRIHLDHSDYNRAMSDFAVAEDLMPGAPEPLLAMGDLFFGRKDYAQSIEVLTVALSQQPDNAMALTKRGMSRYYRKEYEPALEDLQRAAQLDPDIPLLANYLRRVERRVKGLATLPPDRRRR